MKVAVVTDGELRTTIPVILKIEEIQDRPKVYVKELGTVPVKKMGSYFHAEFFVQDPGHYEVVVQSLSGKWNQNLYIKEQQWISFRDQFGFSLILFIIGVLGVFLWVKKIKKKLS